MLCVATERVVNWLLGGEPSELDPGEVGDAAALDTGSVGAAIKRFAKLAITTVTAATITETM